jgi:hypothetical protein
MYEVAKNKVSDREETIDISREVSESRIKTIVLVYNVLSREVQLLIFAV